MKIKKVNLPLTNQQIEKLKVRDIVYLSGTIFIARDKAHKRILEFTEKGNNLPFDLTNGTIFHAGPLAKKEKKGWKIFGIGPTTSSRMNFFTPGIIKKFKIHAVIGKGGMSKDVANAMKNSCVYLAMTGGCSATTTEKIKKIKKIYWQDLGSAEAVYELEVEKLGPLIVAIDSKGKTLY